MSAIPCSPHVPKVLAVSAFLLISSTGCASASGSAPAPVITHSAPVPDAHALVGTWRLVSFESRLQSGEIRYPMGRVVAGQLIYDAVGNVSAHIMDVSRPAFASGDRATGTEAEVRAAFVGYLAYYGTYAADHVRGTVTHHIAGASFPNWICRDQSRLFRLDGDRLTITTPPIRAGGENLITVIIWDRVGTQQDTRRP